MKKIIFSISVLLFLSNCGGIEFVLKKSDKNFTLKHATNINVSGDDSSNVYAALKQSIGDKSDAEATYSLSLNSTKIETAGVIDKDATASKFDIQYKVEYILFNLSKNCKIFENIITTYADYSAKSAGYSFGTDISKNQASLLSINKNVSQFMSSLNQITNLDSCIH